MRSAFRSRAYRIASLKVVGLPDDIPWGGRVNIGPTVFGAVSRASLEGNV